MGWLPVAKPQRSRLVALGVARRKVVPKFDAIATLNDFEIEPCLLNLLAARRIPDSFDRGDCRIANAIDGRDTGAGRGRVQMSRAGTAESHPAAELGAGHAEHVAQHPQFVTCSIW